MIDTLDQDSQEFLGNEFSKEARETEEKEKKALVVKCILVFLMSNVKKLLNLIIFLNLLYLVLCSISHF